MDRRVKCLTVEGTQKQRFPNKNYVYILKVLWSDGTINIVYRKCGDFFGLQEKLLKQFPEAHKILPTLKALKFSKNSKFRLKDGSCKRRTLLNKFCDELINSPDVMLCSNAVLDFCKPSTEDLNPQKSPCCSKSKSASKEKKKTDNQEVHDISGPIVFEQYVVTADYKKQAKNDINLKAGDIVDVIERNEYGWWFVDSDSVLGWAPASYLEPADDDSEVISTQKFAPGEEEVYQSMRPHKAEVEDELSFDIGVVIRIHEKTLDGWWYGSYNGREGWIPAMNLKKFDCSKPYSSNGWTSSTVIGRKDVITYEGTHENSSFSREAPMRRSKVKRSIKRRHKTAVNPPEYIHTVTIPEEDEPTLQLNIGHIGRSLSMCDLSPFSKSDNSEPTMRRKSATLLPLNLSSGSLWTPTPKRKMDSLLNPRSGSALSLPAMLHEQQTRFHDEKQLSTNWNNDLEQVKTTTLSSGNLSAEITNSSHPEETGDTRRMPRSASEINLPSMLHEKDLSISSWCDSVSTGSQVSLPDGNNYDMTDSSTVRRFSSASLALAQNQGGSSNLSPLSLRKLQSKSRMKTGTSHSLPKEYRSLSILISNKWGNSTSPFASSVPGSPVSPLVSSAPGSPKGHLREHRKILDPTAMTSYRPEVSSGQRGRKFAVIMTEEEMQVYQSQLSEKVTLHELWEDQIPTESPTQSHSPNLSDDDGSIDSGRGSFKERMTIEHPVGLFVVENQTVEEPHNYKTKKQSQDGKKEDTEIGEYNNEVFEENNEQNNTSERTMEILEKDVNLVSNNDKSSSDMPKMYQTISAYTAEAMGEVSLREGKTVEVLRQSGSGWWFVRAGGKEGWAPSNFLQIVCTSSGSEEDETKF